jgi:hypothetical protein
MLYFDLKWYQNIPQFLKCEAFKLTHLVQIQLMKSYIKKEAAKTGNTNMWFTKWFILDLEPFADKLISEDYSRTEYLVAINKAFIIELYRQCGSWKNAASRAIKVINCKYDTWKQMNQ